MVGDEKSWRDENYMLSLLSIVQIELITYPIKLTRVKYFTALHGNLVHDTTLKGSFTKVFCKMVTKTDLPLVVHKSLTEPATFHTDVSL